ncbi:hypothetical protein COO60DRAFT_1563697 [Scenedesmus sp. NREL 46B-D3]|nr:hypothetical protein COO60DRAFT_1563697 [Scenedesmus sp. NREL 46B-D3]
MNRRSKAFTILASKCSRMLPPPYNRWILLADNGNPNKHAFTRTSPAVSSTIPFNEVCTVQQRCNKLTACELAKLRPLPAPAPAYKPLAACGAVQNFTRVILNVSASHPASPTQARPVALDFMYYRPSCAGWHTNCSPAQHGTARTKSTPARLSSTKRHQGHRNESSAHEAADAPAAHMIQPLHSMHFTARAAAGLPRRPWRTCRQHPGRH